MQKRQTKLTHTDIFYRNKHVKNSVLQHSVSLKLALPFLQVQLFMKIGRYFGKIRYRNGNSLERQTFMFSFDSKNVLLLTSIELLRTLCVHFGSVFFFFLLQSFRKETGKLDKISGITRHKIRFITSYKRKLHQLLSLYLSISSIHFLFVYYVSA